MLRLKLGHDDDVGPGGQGLEQAHGQAEDVEHGHHGESAGLALIRGEVEGFPGAAGGHVVGQADGAGQAGLTQHHPLGQTC